MTAEEALCYIHSAYRKGAAPGLSRITALLDALGNPQHSLKTIHIAGTNGKGSTAAMTAAILKAAGYRTGLYTSPYLYRFSERMQIDGQQISGDDLGAGRSGGRYRPCPALRRWAGRSPHGIRAGYRHRLDLFRSEEM